MSNYARNLIKIIIGRVEGGKKLKECLWEVSRITGVKYRSIERAWQPGDGYASKATREALQDAVRRKVDYDDAELVRRIEANIDQLEKTDSEMYRPHIDAARYYLALHKDFAASREFVAVPPGVFDDSEE